MWKPSIGEYGEEEPVSSFSQVQNAKATRSLFLKQHSSKHLGDGVWCE